MLIDADNVSEILEELDLLKEQVFVVCIPLLGQGDEPEQSECAVDPKAA